MGHGAPGIVQYNDKEFGQANPGKIGMWVFLVTDAMSFSGLLLAYGVLRAQKGALWPDPIKALGGVELSGFMTFLLICSSVSMVLAIDACRNKKRESMLRWLLITILGGAAFLGIQVYEYHHLMHDMGMTFNSYKHGVSLFS